MRINRFRARSSGNWTGFLIEPSRLNRNHPMSFNNLFHGVRNHLSKSDLLCPKLVLISSTLTWATTSYDVRRLKMDRFCDSAVQAKWKSCNAV